jgi:DNA-binding LacI/PurR family transcriptional regulator
LARSVAAGKSYVFGFLKQGSREQESLMLDGVLKAASEAGYLVKVLIQKEDEHYDDVVQHSIEQRLAGLVLRRYPHKELEGLAKDLKAYKIPFILIDDHVSLPGIGSVTSDDGHGIRLICDHILSLGHRSIGYLAGDCSHPQGLFRRQMFLSVMRERGIDVRGGWVREARWHVQCTKEQTEIMFRDKRDCPTAVLCDGDEVAASAMRTIWGLGLRVPQDVSVTGYAGHAYTDLLYPPLTTVKQPFEEMGSVAVGMLLGIINRGTAGKDSQSGAIELLPTQLLIRGSTAPPRTS